MLLEEILKQEQERFIKENLLSDEMIELLKENIMPFNTLMAYYRCAIMEVETKFKVLNEEFSLSMTEILLRVSRAELSLWMEYLRRRRRKIFL